ncbi:MAG: DUF4105 domain-containing protein [Bacteroidales bacterium]|nr:DUF4105 domain-containing protein [Bacteroidales bacterium]
MHSKSIKNIIISLSLLLSGFFISTNTLGAELSEQAQISLLTCSPGTELYSIFGHSAIWVYDPINKIDKIYNYGTFDFDTPNFYLKFIKGKLDYILARTRFKYFHYEYVVSNRSVIQQTLNLNKEQKQTLYDNLEINYLPENRNYRYDFLFDNCATRIRDIFEKSLDYNIKYDYSIYKEEKSFRDLLDVYIYDSKWLDFGIDLALGLPADKIANPYDYMLLPDHLMNITGEANLLQNDTLISFSSEPKIIFRAKPTKKENYIYSPLNIFWLLFFIYLFITYYDIKKKKPTYLADKIIFGATGLLGIVLTFLWFGTEHASMANNLNTLWAFPFHFVIIFFIKKEKKSPFLKYYFLITAIIMGLILINWFWFPQNLHYSLFPLVLILLIRALNIFYYNTLNPQKTL